MERRQTAVTGTIWTRTLGSLTFWFNLSTALAMVLAVPDAVELLPPTLFRWLAFVNVVGNILIRQFHTAEPITRMAANRAADKARQRYQADQ